MCGRYRRTTQEEELARIYHIPIPKQTDLPISYNIAPSQKVLTIRFNPETQQRSLDALQWGLIPYWAKDPKIAYKTINARVETVDTAPSYRQAFRKRRCLIPADGFYEWKKVVGGEIPYSIGTIQAANFGSLIPTESRRLSPEICCHESPRRWRLLAGAPLSSLRACLLMAPARSLSPDYHTTGADLCTTGSKKHELNLSKARSAGAISMSLLVPLLEFNQVGKGSSFMVVMPLVTAEVNV
ncbi:MAG TPA: SOS response-associated peptidase [Candidatus Acidoferrum sp.]|nr:SOS response-associated peptidase [Candidatus Acidoferrum sp.]